MNKKIFFIFFLTFLMISPLLSLAASAPTINNPSISINQIIWNVKGVILYSLWEIAVAIVIIMFTIAGFKYLSAQGDANKISEANKAVMWGLLGAFVIVLAWSVVWIVRYTIGV